MNEKMYTDHNNWDNDNDGDEKVFLNGHQNPLHP